MNAFIEIVSIKELILIRLPHKNSSGSLPRCTTEIRNAAHAANETMVQCEVIYFMVMHNILVYTGLPARGKAAYGRLCNCEGRSIPAMEYSESCAILLLCLLLPLCPLHVLLEGVADHE